MSASMLCYFEQRERSLATARNEKEKCSVQFLTPRAQERILSFCKRLIIERIANAIER